MLLLHLVSFLVGLLIIGFGTLCLASGLLYLAEVIEENTQAAKRFGKLLINLVILVHLAFYLSDGLPLPLVLLGIFSHLVYLSNFSRLWPSISLTSISFVSSCCLVFVDHFAWFFYFADRVNRPTVHHHHPPIWSSGSSPSRPSDQLTFIDITSFFTLCVWMVPFFLFLSLSASDNVLPNSTDLPLLSSSKSTPPSSLVQKDAQDLVYHPSDLHHSSSPIQFSPPRPPSMLKRIIQNCMKSVPRLGPNDLRGRTSSRPNQGLIATPNPYESCPPSPIIPHPSPRSPVIFLDSSPPDSPAGSIPNTTNGSSTCASRRLSPSRTSASVSPRRAFSSHYHHDQLGSSFLPSSKLPSGLRHVSSSAPLSSLPRTSHIRSTHPHQAHHTPHAGYPNPIFPSVSPQPTPFD